MSAFPNSLVNKPHDPQCELFLSQRAGEWVFFSYSVSERLAERAIQQAPSVQFGYVTVTQLEAPEKPTTVESFESAEMRWLVENSRALETHRGEWLLILKNELVAHSSDFQLIRAAIAERNIRSPFVYYVPTDEESDFIAI